MKYISAAVFLAVVAFQDVEAFSIAGKLKSRVSNKAADMPTLSMGDGDESMCHCNDVPVSFDFRFDSSPTKL